MNAPHLQASRSIIAWLLLLKIEKQNKAGKKPAHMRLCCCAQCSVTAQAKIQIHSKSFFLNTKVKQKKNLIQVCLLCALV